MNSITGLSSEQLRKAADLKERIDGLQAELDALLGGGPVLSAVAKATPGKKRNMSAAGRARIGAAAKARWAKYRETAGTTAPAEKKPKRKFSPAGRARLSALAKERWAKAKRAGKSKL